MSKSLLIVALVLLAILSAANGQTADSYEPNNEIGPSEPIAYYSFNDGTAKDDSGNGIDGQLQGGTLIVPGMIGNAVRLDGTSGSVNVLNAKNFNAGNLLTISFWMNPDATNAMDRCCQGLVTTDYYGIELSGGADP